MRNNPFALFTDDKRLGILRIAILAALLAIVGAAAPLSAQTFSVLHYFTGGGDGSNPYAGLTLDRGGKLYGTTELGGNSSDYCAPTCGNVFRLARSGSSWILSPLYLFHGQDGGSPDAPVVFGPDGSLYGSIGSSNGIIFNLKPPATTCRSSNCLWTETLDFLGCCFSFAPGGITFDQQGNLYGASIFEGRINRCSGGLGCGLVYEMTPVVGDDWNETTLYTFQGNADGAHPEGNLIFDQQGNIYSTTGGLYGGDGFGSVFELNRASGWAKADLHVFTSQFGVEGSFPTAGLIFDRAGNLFGATTTGGTGGGGTVFEMMPSNGSWTYTVIYSFSGSGNLPGVPASLIMDASGSLYGVTRADGLYGYGSVFRLTPSNGNWIFTSLHDFTGGTDGAYPMGSLVLDGDGNLYGTTFAGGTTGRNCANFESYQCGVVFEIAP